MSEELGEAMEWIKNRLIYIAENCDLSDLDNKKAHNNLKTVLKYIDNSISKEVVEKKIEESEKEYKYILDNIERKTARMKDEHKIRATYAEFGVKRGRLEALQELLEGK